MKLFFLLGFPLLELYTLIQLSDYISGFGVILLVVFDVVAGIWLLREYGSRNMARMREKLQTGQMPEMALLDNVLVLSAALLLMFPGIISDILAILLLIPVSRLAATTLFFRKVQQNKAGAHAFFNHKVFYYSPGFGHANSSPNRPAEDVIIDCEIVEETPADTLLVDCTVADEPPKPLSEKKE